MNPAPLPGAPMPDFDKVVHLLMFMGLSGTIFFDNTCYLRKRIICQRLVLGSFLFPVLFSGMIEIIQEKFTTTRSGDWMDFLFDGIGSLIGFLICLLINKRLKIR
jgi:VanZ family protein